jgi:hypothetical protein
MDSVRPPEVRQAASAQFVGFEIAGQKYLFRIERIQEIITSGSVTRVPDVPAYVVGVSNLRGTIIPVIDLRLLFGLPARESDANTAITIPAAAVPEINPASGASAAALALGGLALLEQQLGFAAGAVGLRAWRKRRQALAA